MQSVIDQFPSTTVQTTPSGVQVQEPQISRQENSSVAKESDLHN